MSDSPSSAGSTAIPCLRYRDAPSAIAWLCDTFGFTRQMVVENQDGTIAHAQLKAGNGMVMLGSVLDSPYGKLMRQPDEVGGGQTQSIYLVVPDPDAVFAGQGGGRADRAGPEGPGLWRPRFQLLRPRRPSVDHRQLRSVGRHVVMR